MPKLLGVLGSAVAVRPQPLVPTVPDLSMAAAYRCAPAALKAYSWSQGGSQVGAMLVALFLWVRRAPAPLRQLSFGALAIVLLGLAAALSLLLGVGFALTLTTLFLWFLKCVVVQAVDSSLWLMQLLLHIAAPVVVLGRYLAMVSLFCGICASFSSRVALAAPASASTSAATEDSSPTSPTSPTSPLSALSNVANTVGMIGGAWEAGRLDYVYGGAEVAAFVNTKEQVQLQLVLCAHNEAAPYRMSVLLPHDPNASGIIPVKLLVDGTETSVYAEIVGNALEFQVGANFIITLPESPTFEMVFTKEDAAYLNIPTVVSFPMERANLALSQVAKSCTILCKEQGFTCNIPLISGILWPRDGFNSASAFADTSADSTYKNNGSAIASNLSSHITDKGDLEKNKGGSSSSSSAAGLTADYPSVPVDLDRLCLHYEEMHRTGTESDKRNREKERAIRHAVEHEKKGRESGLVSSIDKSDSLPLFVLSRKCREGLDLVYERSAKDALGFLRDLFLNPTGQYQQYALLWNSAVIDSAKLQWQHKERQVSDYDYYLALFSLFSDHPIAQYPQSYYDILRYNDDPSSFLYAIDNRYELEMVKYFSVLYRRARNSLSLSRNLELAVNAWMQFYQDFTMSLPPIAKAQALRPVIYRQMLMRIWRLAGYPETLRLIPQNAYVQGTNGKTRTNEPLEANCSIFEGSNGDQFFFASNKCISSISRDLRNLGFVNEDYQNVLQAWDRFATAWRASVFYRKEENDVIGAHSRAGIALPLLSLYKVYGFGDYFLLRKCIASRDSDICAYTSYLATNSYSSELRKAISYISEMSSTDGRKLKELSDLWQQYLDSLKTYTDNLVERERIEQWRAYFILGIATNIQSEAIVSTLSYRQLYGTSTDGNL